MRLSLRRGSPSTALLHLLLSALTVFILIYPDKKSLTIPSEPTDMPAPIAVATAAPTDDTEISIKVLNDATGKVSEMALEDYVLCVLAAEMPASFEKEALMAQAVGARTYAVQAALSASRHSDADVCTSSAHCQAFLNADARRERFGSAYEEYDNRLRACVEATKGQIAVYNSQPIVMLFHSSSGGKTEDVENVYSEALPYLRSVDSPGEENASHYSDRVTYTYSELADKLNSSIPGCKVTARTLRDDLIVLSRYESGRVEKVKAGQVTLSGVEFRRSLSLRSANFTFSFSLFSVSITTKGFGHGVGMSQYGANAMALNGYSYIDILTHYYTGISIATVADFKEALTK